MDLPSFTQLLPRRQNVKEMRLFTSPAKCPLVIITGCSYIFQRYPNGGITAKKRFVKLLPLEHNNTVRQTANHLENVPA